VSRPAGKILFDFDGTLAHRPGRWGQCLLDVLSDLSPGHPLTLDHFRLQLRDGFPWHRPEQAHLQWSTPDLWWAHLDPFLLRTYRAVGVADDVAEAAAGRVRSHYCDPARFHLYPDATAALGALKSDGWELVILSNHVPDLSAAVELIRSERAP
jgi:putative hydrolase of the HAD superfamily